MYIACRALTLNGVDDTVSMVKEVLVADPTTARSRAERIKRTVSKPPIASVKGPVGARRGSLPLLP